MQTFKHLRQGILRLLIHVGLLCLGQLTSTWAAGEPGPEDVHKSWDNAHVYVPGKFFRQSTNEISVERPLPVVIYLHGCGGIQKTEGLWGNFFKGAGYIAILPDSFARNRPPSCDASTTRKALWPGATAFRTDELAYAYQKVRAAAWADQSSIFLMGHSQGGYLAATSQLQQRYAGVVISGWRCASTETRWRGLHMPPETPVLVLNHVTDPWYAQENDRKCSEYFEGRPHTQELLLPGHDHATYDPPALDAIRTFLERYRGQSTATGNAQTRP